MAAGAVDPGSLVQPGRSPGLLTCHGAVTRIVANTTSNLDRNTGTCFPALHTSWAQMVAPECPTFRGKSTGRLHSGFSSRAHASIPSSRIPTFEDRPQYRNVGAGESAINRSFKILRLGIATVCLPDGSNSMGRLTYSAPPRLRTRYNSVTAFCGSRACSSVCRQ
mgnify:CR=1 FL=1